MGLLDSLKFLRVAPFLLALLACQSQKASPDSRTVKKALLWKVHGNAGSVYIFGTIHVGVGIGDLPPSVGTALRASQTIRIEVSPEDFKRSDLQKFVNLHASQPKGRSLKSDLTPQEWAQVVKQFHGVLSEATLEKSNPWFVLFEYLNQTADRLNTETTPGLDYELFEAGKKLGLKTGSMETLQSHLESLLAIQAKDLVETSTQEVDDDWKALIELYRRGDERALESEICGKDSLPKDVLEKVLVARNTQWIKMLQKDLGSEENVFIAVGAGHLVCDRGLLKQLAAAGYKVERVTN